MSLQAPWVEAGYLTEAEWAQSLAEVPIEELFEPLFCCPMCKDKPGGDLRWFRNHVRLCHVNLWNRLKAILEKS